VLIISNKKLPKGKNNYDEDEINELEIFANFSVNRSH